MRRRQGLGTRILIGLVAGSLLGAAIGERATVLQPVGDVFIRILVVAVVPLALTSILCEALMVVLGIGVKVATLPVIALGVGIGVDYALYLLSVQLAQQRAGEPFGEHPLADARRSCEQHRMRPTTATRQKLGAELHLPWQQRERRALRIRARPILGRCEAVLLGAPRRAIFRAHTVATMGFALTLVKVRASKSSTQENMKQKKAVTPTPALTSGRKIVTKKRGN